MTFSRVSSVAFAAAFAALPVASQAQDMTVSAGVTATSNYVSNGVSVSNDNPALQGYVEAESRGYYVGAWASTVGDGVDEAELDLYLGYRGEFGQGVSYDVGYTRYFYDDSGNCCGEVTFAIGAPVTDALEVSANFAFDPSSDVLNSSLGMTYALNDRWGLFAEIGTIKDAQDYGSLGLTYALSDAAAVDLSYHDSDIDDGILVFSLSYDMTLLSR